MEFLDFLADRSPLTDRDIVAQIWEIVCESDREFVPPLSDRGSTTQTALSGCVSGETKATKYFDGLLKQSFIVVKEGKSILGFMSFKDRYMCEDLAGLKNRDFCYITTIIVKKEHRGRSLTEKMYRRLFDLLDDGREFVTRTLSTNDAHIHILNRLGFERVYTIPNGRGEGIDTVYFCKGEEVPGYGS